MSNAQIKTRSNPLVTYIFRWVIIALLILLKGCRGESDRSNFRESAQEVVELEGELTEVEEIINPEIPRENLQNEDCLSFDPSGITFQPDGTGFLVTAGRSRMMVFRSSTDARLAVETIRFYDFDKQCFAIRPNPGLRYYTVSGDIPSGGFPGEDCISIRNPENLSIRSSSDTLFQIMDGRSIPYAAKTRDEAERIIEIIQHYQARYTCYVGRPDPGMVYLKK